MGVLIDPRPEVLVWRQTFLPPSETFIVNQIAAMRRWKPRVVCEFRETNPFGVVPSLVLTRHNGRVGARVDARLWSSGRAPVSVRLLRTARRAHLVHAHFGPDAVQVARTARLAARPLVVTFHGYDATTKRPEDYLALAGAHVVAVSEFIRSKALDLGFPPERVAVLPIGIPVPPDPGTGAGDGSILFVGRLVEKKGCEDLLRAVASTKSRPRLRVVGAGPLRKHLENLARRLGVHATFLGALDPAAVAREMRATSLFCVPSQAATNGDAEGFGMVFLEAAAHRLPVVSYRSGGVPEAVVDGTTGLLADEGDVNGLAWAIDQALTPDVARRLGDAGRERVERTYEIGTCTRRLEAFYDRVSASTAS